MIAIINTEPDQVLGKLLADRRRQIYTAQDGSLWIDYQGGEVTPQAVKVLVASGAIVPTNIDGLWVLANETCQS